MSCSCHRIWLMTRRPRTRYQTIRSTGCSVSIWILYLIRKKPSRSSILPSMLRMHCICRRHGMQTFYPCWKARMSRHHRRWHFTGALPRKWNENGLGWLKALHLPKWPYLGMQHIPCPSLGAFVPTLLFKRRQTCALAWAVHTTLLTLVRSKTTQGYLRIVVNRQWRAAPEAQGICFKWSLSPN
jgi:hypothetical protein